GDSIRIRRKISAVDGLDKLEIWLPEEGKFATPTGIDAGLRQILPQVVYIEAFQDPTQDALGKPSATLGKLLRLITSDIAEATQDEIAAALATAARGLNVGEDGTDERIPDLRAVEEAIRSAVAAVFSDVGVRIKFDMPSLGEVFAKGHVLLFEGGVWTDASGKGQGLQRILGLALLQVLADVTARRAGEGGLVRPTCFLVEEPELCLHPSAVRLQRSALERISEVHQVIFTTHSPLMISPQRIDSVVLVRKRDAGSARLSACTPVARTLRLRERKLIDLLGWQSSSEFLFCSKALVVEGISDEYCVQAILHQLTGKGSEDHDIAVVQARDKQSVPEVKIG